MTTDLVEFGRAIRERRESLGLTQLEVAGRGGPSNTTLTKIENGEPPPPSMATLRKLDQGLDWPRGAARAFYMYGHLPGVANQMVLGGLEQLIRPGLVPLPDITAELAEIRDQLNAVIAKLQHAGGRYDDAPEPQQGQGGAPGGGAAGTGGGGGATIGKEPWTESEQEQVRRAVRGRGSAT